MVGGTYDTTRASHVRDHKSGTGSAGCGRHHRIAQRVGHAGSEAATPSGPGGLGSQRPARGRRDGSADSPGGGGLPPRPRPVPLTAAGIGVSSDARRRPETRPLRALAATKLPDGPGSQRPARGRLVRAVDSLAGGWALAAAAKSGRWPVDHRPPHDLSAVTAAPRAGAEGSLWRFKVGLNSRSAQGPVLFFGRPAGRSDGEEKPLRICRLANGVWWADREAVASSRRLCPPLEILARGQRQSRRAAVGARSDEKSALTHFLDWITTWAWTWNNCDRMCEKAA
jgi:hypothetical protein